MSATTNEAMRSHVLTPNAYAIGTRIELACEAEGARKGRLYTLAIEAPRQLAFPNVLHLASFELVITRGRVGGRMVTRREPFVSHAKLVARFDALYKRRVQHEYAVVRVGVA